MGVLGRFGTNALKYYGDILASAYAGLSTADMWTAIHNTQATYGLPKPGASAPDVSVIRGYANRIVAGAHTFAAASPSDTITGDMMAVAPFTSRDLNAISTDPIYHVRYKIVVQAPNGEIKERWTTSVYTATDMPDTVGGLLDSINTAASEAVAQAAQMNSDESGGTLLATTDHEISLV